MPGVREYYDKTAAQWADRWYGDDSMLPVLRRFLAVLPAHPRVLDLCCGVGYEAMRMAALGAQVTGLDLSGESIAIARERNPGLAFHVGDMLEDYAHIGPVDGVACIAGLVHLPEAQLRTAFLRVNAVLRPGGSMLMIVRDGTGRLAAQSDVEVDGVRYDRAFYAHTLEEITRAAQWLLACVCEIPGEAPSPWRNYLFRKPE